MQSEHFEALVKPQSGDRLTHHISEITGITPKMLMYHGKNWKNAYADFYNWLVVHLVSGETNTIVCHNGRGGPQAYSNRGYAGDAVD